MKPPTLTMRKALLSANFVVPAILVVIALIVIIAEMELLQSGGTTKPATSPIFVVGGEPIVVTLTPSVFNRVDNTAPFNLTFDFIMHPVNVSKNIELIVLINTIPSEAELRRQIRESWGDPAEYGPQVHIEFVLGTPKEQEMSGLKAEQLAHNDLVLINFEDSYYNLAVKTFAMLDYKRRRYPEARCLLKADIDNVLLLRNIHQLCNSEADPVILGKCDVPRTVFRSHSKWAVPVHVYPQPLYPHYCSTGAYLLVGLQAKYVLIYKANSSGKTLPEKLAETAANSEFPVSQNFRRLSEDMLFTGLMPQKLGVQRRHVGGFSFDEEPEFLCTGESLFTYSVHMLVNKNHTHHFGRLLLSEGTRC